MGVPRKDPKMFINGLPFLTLPPKVPQFIQSNPTIPTISKSTLKSREKDRRHQESSNSSPQLADRLVPRSCNEKWRQTLTLTLAAGICSAITKSLPLLKATASSGNV